MVERFRLVVYDNHKTSLLLQSLIRNEEEKTMRKLALWFVF